jgi:hypothetical protein
MISHSSLRPSASLFSKHGVCLFCQKSLLVRGYAVRAPSTVRRDDAREPYYKNRTAEEIVARQLGKTYIGGHQKSMPRLPTEILVQAYRTRRIRIPPRTAEQIIREFEPVMKKPSAATTLVSICSSKDIETW